jgi:hypothetical protein
MPKRGGVPRSVSLILVFVAIALLVTACAADLLVTDLGTASFIGSMRQLKVTVANRGSQSAPASQTSVGLGAGPAGPFSTTMWPTPALAPNAEHLIAPIPFPATAQDCYVKACADPSNVAGEGWVSRQNNCLERSFCRP